MSANRYRQCPMCKLTNAGKAEKLQDDLKSKYGVISANEWITLSQEIEQRCKKLLTGDDNLREDWEIGVDASGQFSVDYLCSCEICDFEYAFKHTEPATFEYACRTLNKQINGGQPQSNDND